MKKKCLTSSDLMEYFQGCIGGINRYNTYLKSWEGDAQNFSLVAFPLKDYHGYCLYSNYHVQAAFKNKRKVFNLQEIAKRLKTGMNLIHLSNLPRQPYRASYLMKGLKDLMDKNVLSIQKYQPYPGQWKGAYRFFNKPVESDFELKVGEGYILHIE